MFRLKDGMRMAYLFIYYNFSTACEKEGIGESRTGSKHLILIYLINFWKMDGGFWFLIFDLGCAPTKPPF